jgi:hypothetical protein
MAPTASDNSEDILSYFGTNPSAPNAESAFEAENKAEKAYAEQGQMQLLADILVLLTEDNTSKKVIDIFENYGIYIEKQGFFEKMSRDVKAIKKNLEEMKRWTEKHKKAIAFVAIVIGLGILAYLLLPLFL